MKLLRQGGVRRLLQAGWAALALLAAALPAHAAPVQLTDDRNVTVRLKAPPQRIVTLLPSITETVCELGGCARLVGVDRHSNHPAPVRSLPRMGGLDDANVEMIVSLRPDVVLLGLSSRVTDRLEALGIPVVALEPRSFDDVQRMALKVAQVLGGPDAAGEGQRLWRRIEAQLDAAAQSVPASARGLRVYYEVDGGPYAAGEASFIGQTLARLGARNIVPASLGPFPKLNPEFVVRADPQVLMLSARNGVNLAARPGWERIDALRRRHVCHFNHAEIDVLSRPGPRMGEAAQILARCLRGPLPAAAARPSSPEPRS